MARFFRRGKSKIEFLPAIANTAAPTRPEIAAGTDLSPAIQGLAGFQLTNTPIATPDLSARFNKSIPGEDTTAASSLDFFDDDSGSSIADTARTVLAKGTIGYIVLMPYGDIATKRCEVWQVQSTGVNDMWALGNEAARFAVPFAVLDVPVQNAVIPT
jgi:hypothetical protein